MKPGSTTRTITANVPACLEAQVCQYQAELVKPTTRRILQVYLSATVQGQSFDAELVGIMIFMMQMANASVPLTEEFLASLPPEEAKSPVRQDGLRKMRSGFGTMISGFLTTLTEKQTYRIEQLVRLAKAMKPILPGLLKQMTPLTQQEVPIRLQKLVDDETHPGLKAALADLLKAVKPQ